MAERIRCCVPFCRRTADGEKFKGEEIICGKHWRMASATLRHRRSRLSRRYKRHFGDNNPWDYPAGSKQRLESYRLARLIYRLWHRCKASAIEAAGGI